MTAAEHAPTGTVVREGDRVLCHLCGRWFRSVPAHLRSHGWDHLAYRSAFGLERGTPLEGANTRRQRAAALNRRRATDPAVRTWSDNGRERARSGALTAAAADAARGREQPEQRRLKTVRTLAAISPETRADGVRRHAIAHLRATAAKAAANLGFPDIGALVADRVAAGASLAATSREAGLHKDWLSRHLRSVDPDAATLAAAKGGTRRLDAPWLPVLAALGFADVPTYLHDRHVVRSRSVRAIATETGLSRTAVHTALARHDIGRVPHATTRRHVRDRAAAVATRFGHPDITAYLADRRAAGLSWQAISAECAQPTSWLRRRAGLLN